MTQRTAASAPGLCPRRDAETLGRARPVGPYPIQVAAARRARRSRAVRTCGRSQAASTDLFAPRFWQEFPPHVADRIRQRLHRIPWPESEQALGLGGVDEEPVLAHLHVSGGEIGLAAPGAGELF